MFVLVFSSKCKAIFEKKRPFPRIRAANTTPPTRQASRGRRKIVRGDHVSSPSKGRLPRSAKQRRDVLVHIEKNRSPAPGTFWLPIFFKTQTRRKVGFAPRSRPQAVACLRLLQTACFFLRRVTRKTTRVPRPYLEWAFIALGELDNRLPDNLPRSQLI